MKTNYALRAKYHFPGCQLDDQFVDFLRPCADERYPNFVCEEDAFYPDGSVRQIQPDTVYPFQAPYILGTPIPWEYAHIEKGYSRAVANTVYQYLARIAPSVSGAISQINPFAETDCITGFEIQRNGWRYVIPDYTENLVMVVCDAPENEEMWEDGAVPLFILQQAYLYMALIREHNPYCLLDGILVVRCCGNLTADISYHWIATDEYQERITLSKIDTMIAAKLLAGEQLVPEPNVLPKRNYREIKEAEQESYLYISDDDVHQKLADYMALRSQRRTMTKEVKELESRQKAIALKLASLIPDAKCGTVDDPAKQVSYSVTHRSSSTKKISIKPEHIRLYAPQYCNAITEKDSKGWVDVDVL